MDWFQTLFLILMEVAMKSLITGLKWQTCRRFKWGAFAKELYTEASSTDENIELLVEDGQLIGVVRMIRSPGAEIVYNTELHKGDARSSVTNEIEWKRKDKTHTSIILSVA